MRRRTDMDKIKHVARTLLYLDIQPTAYSPIVVRHPFTSSGFVRVRNESGETGIADLLNKPEDLALWRRQIAGQIDRTDSAYKIFHMLNKIYYLTFVKLAAPALSERDLGRILADAWVQEESPGLDPNINVEDLVALFRSIAPKYLMKKKELQQYQALEDPITIYRGVTSYNAQNIRSISWALDRRTAERFAHHFGEDGTVYEARVSKAHIFAVFLGRNEWEVIVDPKHLEQVMEAPTQDMGMEMT